ncbi:UNVERIFIED_CONTAM: hypothetical protein FKN15_064161 [Acipenser sinensis]
MLSSRLQCALALLSLALAVSSVSAAPSDPRLRQLLQRTLSASAGKQVFFREHSLHPQGSRYCEAIDLQGIEELLKYSLAELLSELAQSENDALASDELSRAAEQNDVRLELERSANGNPAMAPRERKAGCKNFFWKTFTSC